MKPYTWKEKIDSLAKLAKAAGRYIESGETEVYSPSGRSDYYHDARQKFREAYEEFCQWRHDEPYVVDEIKALLQDPTMRLTWAKPHVDITRDGVLITSQVSSTIMHNQFLDAEAMDKIIKDYLFKAVWNEDGPTGYHGSSNLEVLHPPEKTQE